MNTMNRALLLSLLLAGTTLNAQSSHAAVDPRAFGERWQSQGTPSDEQSQVIYYRDVTPADKNAAMVYIDGEFQAALLPGMFTRFCVAAGSHSLAAYSNDAPTYKGKTDQSYRATLKGGKTYFVRVDSEVNGRPLAVRRADAENQLAASRLQQHALSRASAVVSCDYSEKPTRDYTLQSDVLFSFGKSGKADMQQNGHDAIESLVVRLKREGIASNRIEVLGHTDALGKAENNQKLGQHRAQTVAQMLIANGIPAQNLTIKSLGSSQPVVQCVTGDRQQRIACSAPNRRVVVRVETAK